MTDATAGIGDPYWYEWSIGQSYLIQMLDASSNIESVALQMSSSFVKGLDDVVVRFRDGDIHFIQVKHTREEDTLTFGDLVGADQDLGDVSLLGRMAGAWSEAKKICSGTARALLVTNRTTGRRRAFGTKNGNPPRPALAEFLPALKLTAAKASKLADIDLGTASLNAAWNGEWLNQLAVITNASQKIEFIKSLDIITENDGLEQITESLRKRLERLFSVPPEVARDLLARLDSGLRQWATSSREREFISSKEVYATLCLQCDRMVGEHELPVPAPFFKSRADVLKALEGEVQSRLAPVIFVCGSPGSGKTAMLSALANRQQPVIDLRYHAYRPITPDNPMISADAGRTVSARALWNDLLLQLRVIAGGRTEELLVPIHAGSLSEDKLRYHVLRIAQQLGAERNRPIVIAIDGIDHAARATGLELTFLASLIPPDLVPGHVTFLIGGQPPEGYQLYPSWLRIPTQGVRRFDLPLLSNKDAEILLAQDPVIVAKYDIHNAAIDIYHHCQGNTLSTVFAVKEANLFKGDPKDFSRHLAERGLSSGIDAYYASIWISATVANSEPDRVRLAACLSLMPSRITGVMLNAIFTSHGASESIWEDRLRALRPLVIQEEHGYRFFHNDVRIFLARQTLSDRSLTQSVAKSLAEYVRTGSDAEARHSAAQALYGVAEDHRAQAAIFTSNYVIEAFAISRPPSEVLEQGLLAASRLSQIAPDWELAHEVALALRTNEQLRKCSEWSDAEGIRVETKVFRKQVRMAERSVRNTEDWTWEIITRALDEIKELVDSDEPERARDCFRRWFHGVSPTKLVRFCGKEVHASREHEERRKREKALALLGEVGAHLCLLSPYENKDFDKNAEAFYASGLMHVASGRIRMSDFLRLFGRSKSFFHDSTRRCLLNAIKQQEWGKCYVILDILSPNSQSSLQHRLIFAVAAVLTGERMPVVKWMSSLPSNPSELAAESAKYTSDTDVQGLAPMYPPVQNEATKPEPMAGCGGVKSGQ